MLARTRTLPVLVSLLLFVLELLSPAAQAADANFYTFHDQWVKESKTPKTDKEAAINEGFSRAVENRSLPLDIGGAPIPMTLRRGLTEAASTQTTLELELHQTLLLENIGGLVKFIATDEGLLTLENVDSETLKVVATGIGSTFVHVWNARGRSTIPIRVIPPKLSTSRSQLRQMQEIERSRPFRFGYDNSRTAAYTGDKFREAQRSSVDFTQDFRLGGDTPYGEVYSHAQTQKARGKNLLTDAQIELRDGKVGAFKNFNATAGDSQAKPDLMVLPVARIRGAQVEHWNPDKSTQWTGFYGRENSSLIGAISPGVVTKRTLNSYLSGVVLDQKVNDASKVRAGYLNGFGRSREDELNRHGFGVHGVTAAGKHNTLDSEVDFDTEKFAHKHSFTTRYEKLQVKHEYRDISKKFFALNGPPSKQGELGYLLDVSATPVPQWAFSGVFDVFRDRLIPNPEDPKRLNMHTDLQLNYFPCDELSYTLSYQDLDDTGRVGPTRYRVISFQYNESFDAWGHKASIFTRYNHRTNHLLTNSLSDYRQDQVTIGLNTALFWGINFSIQQEWSALEEVEISQYTHPSARTYTLDKSDQFGSTPFFWEARLRWRDEEATESSNSFMAGEDSAEFSGGLFYREYEDLELFLTGSATQYIPESLNVASPRIEAQFYTGIRGSFDTGLRWTAVGAFEGYVFKDSNGDGQKQEEETGFPGMKVISSDGKEAVTDQEGHYQIKGVSGKKVSLTLENVNIPYGFVPSSPISPQFDIVQKKTQRADFGLSPRSDVTGIVFNDLDGDGKFSPGEPGLPRVRLSLDGGKVERTNSQGVYTFSSVSAGDHVIELAVPSLPEGYLPAQAPKKAFKLFEGIRYELRFPLKAAHVVTGRVFADADGDGQLDEGEEGLADVPVRLGTQKVLTDKDGWFLFDGVAKGKFELSVDTSGPLKGWAAPKAVPIEMTSEPATYADMHIPVKKQAA